MVYYDDKQAAYDDGYRDGAMGAHAELTDLRAYKAKTEAALVKLYNRAGIDLVSVEDLKWLGLWREPEGGA